MVKNLVEFDGGFTALDSAKIGSLTVAIFFPPTTTPTSRSHSRKCYLYFSPSMRLLWRLHLEHVRDQA